MPANTVVAVDTGSRTLLEHKKEFEKIGVLTLRVGSMLEAILLLHEGEPYKCVVINEDSIPDFMEFLKTLCNAARTHVFITSHSYDKTKHTRALHAGADAYVAFGKTAKVDIDCALEHLELTPKWIQRQLRVQAFLTGGEIALSPSQRQVFVRQQPMDLSKKDFDILHYFISNTDIALSYEQLFDKVWGRGYDESGHKLLWNHIYVLRQAIKTATGSNYEYIRMEKDFGYRFQPPFSIA